MLFDLCVNTIFNNLIGIAEKGYKSTFDPIYLLKVKSFNFNAS